MLAPVLATQALYRLRNVSKAFPAPHFLGEQFLALPGSERLWNIVSEFGYADTKKMLKASMGNVPAEPFKYMSSQQCLEAHDWLVYIFDNLDFRGKKSESITIAMMLRIPWKVLLTDKFYSKDPDERAQLERDTVSRPLSEVSLKHFEKDSLQHTDSVYRRTDMLIRGCLRHMPADGNAVGNRLRLPVTLDMVKRPNLPRARNGEIGIFNDRLTILPPVRRSTLRVEPLEAGAVGPTAQNYAKAVAGDTSDVVNTAESDDEGDDCEFGDHSVDVDQFHPDAEEEDQVEEDESDVDDPDFEYDADDVYLDHEDGQN